MGFVLIVENDPVISATLSESFVQSGWQAVVVASVADAKAQCRKQLPDLVLLDLELNDGFSFSLCRELHEESPTLPILVITATLDEETAVKALSLGARDYIRKPFGRRELMLRVRKIMGTERRGVRLGELVVDVHKRIATYRGASLSLSPTEIALLAILMERVDDTVTREKLLERIDEEASLSDQTLKSYISRLRTKLREGGVVHADVVSVYGLGYRLEKKK